MDSFDEINKTFNGDKSCVFTNADLLVQYSKDTLDKINTIVNVNTPYFLSYGEVYGHIGKINTILNVNNILCLSNGDLS